MLDRDTAASSLKRQRADDEIAGVEGERVRPFDPLELDMRRPPVGRGRGIEHQTDRLEDRDDGSPESDALSGRPGARGGGQDDDGYKDEGGVTTSRVTTRVFWAQRSSGRRGTATLPRAAIPVKSRRVSPLPPAGENLY